MKYLYTAALVLSLAACKKEKPQPALEGRWDHERRTEVYQSSGTRDFNTSQTGYVVLDAGTWRSYEEDATLSSPISTTYTRSGNKLLVSYPAWGGFFPQYELEYTILKLTENELQLQRTYDGFDPSFPPGTRTVRTVTTEYFSR